MTALARVLTWRQRSALAVLQGFAGPRRSWVPRQWLRNNGRLIERRILDALVRDGFAEVDPKGRYRPRESQLELPPPIGRRA